MSSSSSSHPFYLSVKKRVLEGRSYAIVTSMVSNPHFIISDMFRSSLTLCYNSSFLHEDYTAFKLQFLIIGSFMLVENPII
jgi:hypothetical protein